MANDKKFVVKNGLQTQNIDFVSPNGANTIQLTMLDDDYISFSGNSGQLFSISDDLTGTIFSVNDISGVPSIEVDADGTVRVAEFDGNVLIGTDIDDGTSKLQVSGNIAVTGTVDGRDVSVDGAKLDGIEANATADMTASEILSSLLTVDGASSGLDADLLDGQHGSYYLNAGNMSVGTLPDARLSSNVALKNATNTFTVNQNIITADSSEIRLRLSNSAVPSGIDFLINTSGSWGFYDRGANAWRLNFAQGTNTATFSNAVSAVSFSGNGSSLTSLNAGNISSGTLAVARGGTGIASYTTGNYIRASAATTLEQRTPAQVLSDIGAASNGISITAGNGLTGGGTLAATRTLTLGTPSSITASTTNSVTSTSHTHALSITAADINASPVGHSHAIADVTGLQASLDTKAPAAGSGVVQLEGNFTLSPATSGRFLHSTSGTASVITIPPHSSAGWSLHTSSAPQFEGAQGGAGSVTISPASGVTLFKNSRYSNTTAGQYSVWGLKMLAQDQWLLFGDLGAA